MEGVRFIPCPDNGQEECKYAPNCHLSDHHIYPRRTMDSPLKKKFGSLPVNRIVSCRMIHDFLDMMPEPRYPSETEMDRIIMREHNENAA